MPNAARSNGGIAEMMQGNASHCPVAKAELPDDFDAQRSGQRLSVNDLCKLP
jgi:hypothetical protein